jgi:hypothetical protein
MRLPSLHSSILAPGQLDARLPKQIGWRLFRGLHMLAKAYAEYPRSRPLKTKPTPETRTILEQQNVQGSKAALTIKLLGQAIH